jgi:hypothetical protein
MPGVFPGDGGCNRTGAFASATHVLSLVRESGNFALGGFDPRRSGDPEL